MKKELSEKQLMKLHKHNKKKQKALSSKRFMIRLRKERAMRQRKVELNKAKHSWERAKIREQKRMPLTAAISEEAFE